MCGFTITNRKISDVNYVDHFTRLRGPDGTTVTEIAGVTIIHHLLWLTGNRTPQPFIDDDLICVFNGEIYNYKKFGDYDTDGECLLPLFREYGNDFTKHLDGEFSIVILDQKNDKIGIFRDTFGTKPCYSSIEGNDFAISSYASSLKRLGFSNWDVPKRMPHDFSLIQYKDTYQDWIVAFENAVKKRISDKPTFIGLSSDYDSGAIDCALQKENADYTAITIGEEFLEGRNSLRIALPDDLRTIDISYIDQEFTFEIKKNISTYGQTQLFKAARDMGLKVCLSGQGADEVMWDYDEFNFATHRQILGENFFGKKQMWYLGQEERVSGAHGIESRYPFLDPQVVQEYLWLTPELKNRYFKAPIHEYLTGNDYPFEPSVKRGFGMGIKGIKHVKKIPKDDNRYKIYEAISKLK